MILLVAFPKIPNLHLNKTSPFQRHWETFLRSVAANDCHIPAQHTGRGQGFPRAAMNTRRSSTNGRSSKFRDCFPPIVGFNSCHRSSRPRASSFPKQMGLLLTSNQAVMSALPYPKMSILFTFSRSLGDVCSRLVAAYYWLSIGWARNLLVGS